MVLRRILPALVAPMLFACTQEKASRDEPIITIEGGVTIVTNPGLHLADTLAWSIDTAKVVRIGVFEGDDEYMFGRVSGVLLRSDGSVLVADADAHEVRVFDANGNFVRKVGRKGSGPDEFRMFATALPHTGDSIAVLDWEGGRINILDPDLNYVRSFRARLQETRAREGFTSHRLQGFFSDGTLFIRDSFSSCGPAREGGFCEDSVTLFRTDSEGATKARFGVHVRLREQRLTVKNGPSTSWREPHPQAFWALQGDRVYYADAKRFEYRVYQINGHLERIVRVNADPPQYSREQAFPHVANTHTDPGIREATRVLNESFSTAAVPDTLPHFSDMLVDVTGHVWLREYKPPARRLDPAPSWYIFDPQGRLRYALRSPGSLVRFPASIRRPNPQIGTDRIVVPAWDAHGVEQVLIYRLTKRPGQ